MEGPTSSTPAAGRRPPGDVPDHDTTEWLDWDHWQGVDEYQDIVDGLGGARSDENAADGDTADEAARRQLRRGLYRRGIALED